MPASGDFLGRRHRACRQGVAGAADYFAALLSALRPIEGEDRPSTAVIAGPLRWLGAGRRVRSRVIRRDSLGCCPARGGRRVCHHGAPATFAPVDHASRAKGADGAPAGSISTRTSESLRNSSPPPGFAADRGRTAVGQPRPAQARPRQQGGVSRASASSGISAVQRRSLKPSLWRARSPTSPC